MLAQTNLELEAEYPVAVMNLMTVPKRVASTLH